LASPLLSKDQCGLVDSSKPVKTKNNYMKNKLTIMAAAVAALMGADASVQAVPITGSVTFGGSVQLAGREIGGLDEDGRARVRNEAVGFVFQNFQLIPTLTALENVLVPLELRGESGHEGDARALLERVGLGARLDHYPVKLSGGEQQRVALARAFMNRPRILFCDEPTGNLDGDTAHAMVDLIFGLNRERGTTLVLVTHDLELAGRTQRIIRLRNGAVVSDEKTSVT